MDLHSSVLYLWQFWVVTMALLVEKCEDQPTSKNLHQLSPEKFRETWLNWSTVKIHSASKSVIFFICLTMLSKLTNFNNFWYIQGGPKTRLFWELLNLRQLIGKRCVIFHKFHNFVKKVQKWHVSAFKCSLLSLHKTSCKIMLNLTKHMDFTQYFTRTYSESNSKHHMHTEFV